jgi:hypothetical protein
LFLVVFGALDVPTKGLSLFFGHHQWQSPPLGFGLLWTTKCSYTNLLTLLWKNVSCPHTIHLDGAPRAIGSLWHSFGNPSSVLGTFCNNWFCSKHG